MSGIIETLQELKVEYFRIKNHFVTENNGNVFSRYEQLFEKFETTITTTASKDESDVSRLDIKLKQMKSNEFWQYYE